MVTKFFTSIHFNKIGTNIVNEICHRSEKSNFTGGAGERDHNAVRISVPPQMFHWSVALCVLIKTFWGLGEEKTPKKRAG